MPLAVSPCLSLCDWAPSRAASPLQYDGLPLFACRGCGTQWVRSESWTPAQADGTVPEVVLEERQRG